MLLLSNSDYPSRAAAAEAAALAYPDARVVSDADEASPPAEGASSPGFALSVLALWRARRRRR